MKTFPVLSLCFRANLVVAASAMLVTPGCFAQTAHIATQRGDATVLVEPYAPNIVRVSLSLRKDDALAAPGYGITAQPAAAGWTESSGEHGDVLKSKILTVTIAPRPKRNGPLPETAKFFSGSTDAVDLNITTSDGKTLLHMNGWQMAVPNYKEGTHDIEYDNSTPESWRYGCPVSQSHEYRAGSAHCPSAAYPGSIARCLWPAPCFLQHAKHPESIQNGLVDPVSGAHVPEPFPNCAFWRSAGQNGHRAHLGYTLGICNGGSWTVLAYREGNGECKPTA